MGYKVFIDGSAGTTGLRIHQRLEGRNDIELIAISDDLRKDAEARKACMAQADLVFLCLPDQAAIEACNLLKDLSCVVIDASTAHRVNPDWVYGMPELKGMKQQIANARFIANPGCHASGFIALVAPLVQEGLLSPDAFLSCTSLTGYSGGGKQTIAQYESEEKSQLLGAPRAYSLQGKHKHLPEMIKVAGLNNAPGFVPVIGDYYSGMEVIVTLQGSQLKGTKEDIAKLYEDYYQEGLIHFNPCETGEEGFLSASAFADRDDMELLVLGNSDCITLISRFDNLGKGASGAAIQNMNIVFGLSQSAGLVV